MYRIDDVGSTYLSLPPNLQNTGNECFAYAFDRQIKRLYKLAEKLTVWSDIDHADPKYYDYMAMTIRAPYYKSEYNDKQKEKLIKAALEERRHAGTVRAIERLLSHSILCAEFVPWYAYGGKPYHFKIRTSDDPKEEAVILFKNMLERVKAARSIIDGIEIDHDPIRNTIYIGTAMQQQGTICIKNMEIIDRRIFSVVYTGCAAVIKEQIAIKKEE